MKCHHPAAHMAAFMQHRPGFYNQMTLEEEARRFGVSVLFPAINRSGTRFDLVRNGDGHLAILKPLAAINGVSEEIAQQIVWARLNGPFESVEELASRVWLPRDVLDPLARSGALDTLAGDSRRALWEVGVLSRRLEGRRIGPQQQAENRFIDTPVLSADDIPELPELSRAERLSWDYKTQSSSRVHPIILARRYLNDLNIQPIESIYRMIPVRGSDREANGPLVTLAGVVIVRQKPGTAKGFMFLSIEDESGFVQCVVHPSLQERFYDVLLQPALIVRGEIQATGNWRALVLREVWPLQGVFGGYAGFPSANTGSARLRSDLDARSAEILSNDESEVPLPYTATEAS